jgi:hypothetical protein
MPHVLTLQPLAGRWIKTNHDDAQWIRAIDVDASGSKLRVRVHGDASASDWGEVETDDVYALAPDSQDGAAFVAHFTLPKHEVSLEANMNLGLLVVAAFTRRRDDPGAVGQFTREFFYRSGAA